MNDDLVSDDAIDLLRLDDLCHALKLGRTVVYRLLNSGAIPSIRIAHQHRVRRCDLEAFVAAQVAAVEERHAEIASGQR